MQTPDSPHEWTVDLDRLVDTLAEMRHESGAFLIDGITEETRAVELSLVVGEEIRVGPGDLKVVVEGQVAGDVVEWMLLRRLPRVTGSTLTRARRLMRLAMLYGPCDLTADSEAALCELLPTKCTATNDYLWRMSYVDGFEGLHAALARHGVRPSPAACGSNRRPFRWFNRNSLTELTRQ